MNKNFLLASQFICILFVSPWANAQPHDFDREEHEIAYMTPEKQLDDPTLNLTQEQKDKLKKLFSDSKAEMKKAGKEVWEKRRVLRDAILDDKKSEKDLNKVHDELDNLQKHASNLHFKLMLQLRNIMSSEQRKFFFENMETRRKKHHEDKE